MIENVEIDIGSRNLVMIWTPIFHNGHKFFTLQYHEIDEIEQMGFGC